MIAGDLRKRVLRAYKDILRAREHTFKGDECNLYQFKKYAKEQFLLNKDERDPIKIENLVRIANDSAEIIRRNIVQAVKVNKEGEDVYVLNIDPSKEINNNDRSGKN